MAYVYVLGTILFTVYGQVVLKWRIVNYGEMPAGIVPKLMFLLQLFMDPFIASGFVAAFVASLFWMAAMTKLDLSHAYPLIVGGLAIVTSSIALVFLNEQFTLAKGAGLALIVVGIYLVGSS